MPKKIDPALRERAVRLVLEHRSEYPSNAKVIAAVARQECVGAESLRRWVIQAEIDAGDRGGQTSEEHAEIRRLKAENLGRFTRPGSAAATRTPTACCASTSPKAPTSAASAAGNST